MLDSRVVFLDLETTGASADRDRITEIGLIEVTDGQFSDEWSMLVNPGRPIPPGIVTLTGITDEMVTAAPCFAELSTTLLERLEGRLLVAHNARFDYAFLRAEFQRSGVRFRPRVLCTVRLSRLLFPEHSQHNLDSIIERFGFSCAARHRALGDAQVLWSFARELARRFDADRLSAAVTSLTQLPMLPPGIDPERFDDLPAAPGVYVFYANDGTPLYAGRSTNLRSRVLAHFTAHGDLRREQELALQTASLEWTETAGELGAALRMTALLRKLKPLYNRARDAFEAWSFRWEPDHGITLVELHDQSAPDALYGVFRSRNDALSALRGLARAHQFCRILTGLEVGPGACSAYHTGACRGACIGKEPPALHTVRLISALARLRLPSWPFNDRIAIREVDASRALSEVHVLDRWRYIGSARTDADLDALLEAQGLPDFDVDHYRLISRYLAQPGSRATIVDLSRQRKQAWDAMPED